MSTILRWITLLQNWSVTGKGLGDKVDKLDRRRIVKGIKEVLRFDVPTNKANQVNMLQRYELSHEYDGKLVLEMTHHLIHKPNNGINHNGCVLLLLLLAP